MEKRLSTFKYSDLTMKSMVINGRGSSFICNIRCLHTFCVCDSLTIWNFPLFNGLLSHMILNLFQNFSCRICCIAQYLSIFGFFSSLIFCRPNGSYFCYFLTLSPLLKPHGPNCYATLTSININKKKKPKYYWTPLFICQNQLTTESYICNYNMWKFLYSFLTYFVLAQNSPVYT